MTGRERIERAFAPEGTPEIGAVICYEGIYIRDHWAQLTACPWWYQMAPDTERQMAWVREVARRIGQDWLALPGGFSHDDREALAVEERDGQVYRRDRRTGREEPLAAPQVGGWSVTGQVQSHHPPRPPMTREAIDRLVPEPPPFAAAEFRRQGYLDLSDAVQREFGRDLLPFGYVASPLWRCYSLWGFEGLMTLVAERPDLVRYATERFLAAACHTARVLAAFSARAAWIEECFTDMVSPAAFRALNVPVVRRLAEELRAAGLFSIYYYCGNPWDRFDALLDVGADALSLEEGKKGFEIDITQVVDAVRGRCVVFGNLDAVRVLEHGTEPALRAEIARQIQAGRRNGGRFVMSIGSPVTPGTTPDRVRRYLELSRESGRVGR
jgi:uroporphyrinogen-III decarboxylase